MPVYHAATSPEVTPRETRNLHKSRTIAGETMVLLKNNGILPLHLDGRRIALFGNGVRHTVQGGTGSGEVNTRSAVTVEQGFLNAGATVTTGRWLDRYDEGLKTAYRAEYEKLKPVFADSIPGGFWMLTATRPHIPMTLEEADLAPSDDSTAVYVLARNSGEGADRKNDPGDYQLSAEEEACLTALCRHYDHVIVVLNVGGVMDTTFLRSQPKIDAILLMSQLGNCGGDALADVLSGAVNPSGHLTTTWALSYDDYPNAPAFSSVSGNRDDAWYAEGIYVGYRWFDATGKEVAYPFGFGLSYTTFSMETNSVEVDETDITVKTAVTNTGNRPGKQVVQIYVSAPAGKLAKPVQELRGYGKTALLQPGETGVVTVTFPIASLASYDEETASWLLEHGDYRVRVGAHSRDTQVAAVLHLSKTVVTEKLTNLLPLDCDLNLFQADPAQAISLPENEAPVLSLDHYRPAPRPVQEEQPHPAVETYLTMDDVRAGRCTPRQLADQLTEEELALLCVGTAREGMATVIGQASNACPGAAGDTTSAMLERRNIRNMVLADGPAGLRLCAQFNTDENGRVVWESLPFGSFLMDTIDWTDGPKGGTPHYQYCTAIPIATALAQSWDLDLIRQAGDLVGGEMEEFGITLWLAPGMNIHRNPLCGRNFEYYAEDPLVSGLCAMADTQGVQSHRGVGTTIKHFACNNLEDARCFNNAHVPERALREIYLKGFEIAVKQSQPLSIMTSYNLLNGTHTANSHDLLTKIARDEWGFAGFVMTDWGTTNPFVCYTDDPWRPIYDCSDPALCIAAGNDLIMPGSQKDVDGILAALGKTLSLEQLRICAARILAVLARSNAYPAE